MYVKFPNTECRETYLIEMLLWHIDLPDPEVERPFDWRNVSLSVPEAFWGYIGYVSLHLLRYLRYSLGYTLLHSVGIGLIQRTSYDAFSLSCLSSNTYCHSSYLKYDPIPVCESQSSQENPTGVSPFDIYNAGRSKADKVITNASSCRQCRAAKVRCSGILPCSRCSRRRDDCVFPEDDPKVAVSEK